MKAISLLVVLAGAGACGGDDGSAFEGIYSVATWTENNADCNAEGASVKETRDPKFYVKMETFFGVDFLNVKDCMSTEDCKMLAADKDTIHIGEFGFDEGSDSAGWSSHATSAFGMSGMCSGSAHRSTFTGTKGEGFKIESRRFEIPPYTPSGTECSDEEAEQHVSDTCSSLEVITATFDSGL